MAGLLADVETVGALFNCLLDASGPPKPPSSDTRPVDVGVIVDAPMTVRHRGPAVVSRMSTKLRESIYGSPVRASAERAKEARRQRRAP